MIKISGKMDKSNTYKGLIVVVKFHSFIPDKTFFKSFPTFKQMKKTDKITEKIKV